MLTVMPVRLRRIPCNIGIGEALACADFTNCHAHEPPFAEEPKNTRRQRRQHCHQLRGPLRRGVCRRAGRGRGLANSSFPGFHIRLHHHLGVQNPAKVSEFFNDASERIDRVSVKIGQQSRVIDLPHIQLFHRQHPRRFQEDLRIDDGESSPQAPKLQLHGWRVGRRWIRHEADHPSLKKGRTDC